MKERVYISLPVSGRNLDDVIKRANFIKSSVGEEYDPITPFDVCPDSSLPYNELMGRDVAELLKCQTILLDYDWRESRGCRAEYEIAQIYGLRIIKLAKDNTIEELSNGRQYNIQLNNRQLRVLSDACNYYSRILCGQLDVGMEVSLEKGIAREYGYETFDRRHAIREKCDELLGEIKMLVWEMGRGASHGVGYDEESDILFDIHQVLRHQLWKESPEQSCISVASSIGISFGNEPMITIQPINANENSR